VADIGYVRAQLKGISDVATQRVLTTVFEHILGNLRLGEPDHQTRAENFQAYFLSSTTASDTGEFSIAHGLNATPKLALQVIDLQAVGAKAPQLEVSRVADARRIYLKAAAGSTNAAFTLLVEA
jgi:hypothetical protein